MFSILSIAVVCLVNCLNLINKKIFLSILYPGLNKSHKKLGVESFACSKHNFTCTLEEEQRGCSRFLLVGRMLLDLLTHLLCCRCAHCCCGAACRRCLLNRLPTAKKKKEKTSELSKSFCTCAYFLRILDFSSCCLLVIRLNPCLSSLQLPTTSKIVTALKPRLT